MKNKLFLLILFAASNLFSQDLNNFKPYSFTEIKTSSLEEFKKSCLEFISTHPGESEDIAKVVVIKGIIENSSNEFNYVTDIYRSFEKIKGTIKSFSNGNLRRTYNSPSAGIVKIFADLISSYTNIISSNIGLGGPISITNTSFNYQHIYKSNDDSGSYWGSIGFNLKFDLQNSESKDTLSALTKILTNGCDMNAQFNVRGGFSWETAKLVYSLNAGYANLSNIKIGDSSFIEGKGIVPVNLNLGFWYISNITKFFVFGGVKAETKFVINLNETIPFYNDLQKNFTANVYIASGFEKYQFMVNWLAYSDKTTLKDHTFQIGIGTFFDIGNL